MGGAARVKEVWIWGYHGGVLDLWESNMASPFGAISNSNRDPNDLPVLKSTYTVYHYNYQRGASEAVEDHMHQFEAVLASCLPFPSGESLSASARLECAAGGKCHCLLTRIVLGSWTWPWGSPFQQIAGPGKQCLRRVCRSHLENLSPHQHGLSVRPVGSATAC